MSQSRGLIFPSWLRRETFKACLLVLGYLLFLGGAYRPLQTTLPSFVVVRSDLKLSHQSWEYEARGHRSWCVRARAHSYKLTTRLSAPRCELVCLLYCGYTVPQYGEP